MACKARMLCICKHGTTGMVLWTYLLKIGEVSFYCAVVTVRVSVRLRVRFQFSDRVGIGFSDVH